MGLNRQQITITMQPSATTPSCKTARERKRGDGKRLEHVLVGDQPAKRNGSCTPTPRTTPLASHFNTLHPTGRPAASGSRGLRSPAQAPIPPWLAAVDARFDVTYTDALRNKFLRNHSIPHGLKGIVDIIRRSCQRAFAPDVAFADVPAQDEDQGQRVPEESVQESRVAYPPGPQPEYCSCRRLGPATGL